MGYKSEPAKELLWVRSRRVLVLKLPLFSPPQSGLWPSWHTDVEYCQLGKLTQALVSLVFGVALLCRHSWLNHWLCDSISSLLPSPEIRLILGGSKPQTSTHMFGLSGMTSPHPESSPSHKLSRDPPWVIWLGWTVKCGLSRSLWIAKKFLPLAKSQKPRV